MKWMSSYIEIGDLIFKDRVVSIEVNSNRKEISSTAVIRIPRFNKFLVDGSTSYKIKPGQPVVIKVGYDGEFKFEWTGYVSSIKPNTPLEINCEDEMWLLKQEQISASWESIKLDALLKYIAPKADVSAPEIELEPFRLDKVTKAQALNKIKEEYGIDVYFRGKTLYAGLSYGDATGGIQLHFQKNVPSVSQQSGLVFKKKEDVKLKVKAISILPDNTRVEAELGDPDGEQRTLTFYNIKTEGELKKIAAERINQLKYDGYTGSITAFGWPVAIHGNTVEFIDNNYPERSSKVFIDAVKTTYDSNGYRQELELGRSATAVLINE